MELIDPNFCFCLSSLSFIHIVFLCIIGEYIDNFTDVTVLFLSFFLVSIFLYNSWFVWFVFLFRCGGGGGSGEWGVVNSNQKTSDAIYQKLFSFCFGNYKKL